MPHNVDPSRYRDHATPCQPGASGQCDGYSDDFYRQCKCACHSLWTDDLPETVAGVKARHDELWGIVPTDEGN